MLLSTAENAEMMSKLEIIHNELEELNAKCIEAIEVQNNIDLGQELMYKIDMLKTQALKISEPKDERNRSYVCEISGNFMSSTDNEDRMRAHFEGKQYMLEIGMRNERERKKSSNMMQMVLR